MIDLLRIASQCTLCAERLPLGANPVFSAAKSSRILIVGQAPGLAVHRSGIPWDDKSGSNLRDWLAVDQAQFYNPDVFGIVPMAFCYPGKGKSGDLPPSKECAPQWHQKFLAEMKQLELILLIGKFAQDYYLPSDKSTLTERVRNYKKYLPEYFVLPHPSPRNNIWQAKNEWFKATVLPELKNKVHQLIS